MEILGLVFFWEEMVDLMDLVVIIGSLVDRVLFSRRFRIGKRGKYFKRLVIVDLLFDWICVWIYVKYLFRIF